LLLLTEPGRECFPACRTCRRRRGLVDVLAETFPKIVFFRADNIVIVTVANLQSVVGLFGVCTIDESLTTTAVVHVFRSSSWSILPSLSTFAMVKRAIILRENRPRIVPPKIQIESSRQWPRCHIFPASNPSKISSTGLALGDFLHTCASRRILRAVGRIETDRLITEHPLFSNHASRYLRGREPPGPVYSGRSGLLWPQPSHNRVLAPDHRQRRSKWARWLSCLFSPAPSPHLDRVNVGVRTFVLAFHLPIVTVTVVDRDSLPPAPFFTAISSATLIRTAGHRHRSASARTRAPHK